MIVYPAMDLMGGDCVRLAQGRFEDATLYPADPAEALATFAAAGAAWAHVVDLDGARAGSPRQHDLIAGLARATLLALQVAGGFREHDQLQLMFDAGIGRVVIGSLAVSEPDIVRGYIAAFGAHRITLALDVNLVEGVPMVATAGWTETSALSLWDVAAYYPEARHMLITDIGCDGMMAGPNTALIQQAVTRLPHLAIQASGGVGRIEDLAALAQAGAAGAIVGKALWERRIDLGQAVAYARA